MDYLTTSKRKYYAIALLLVIGFALFYTHALPFPTQSIVPGFEGMQNGIWGYQVRNNPATVIGGLLPSPDGTCTGGYTFSGSASITSESIQVKTPNFGLCGAGLANSDIVTVDAQENPVSSNNPFTTGQMVNYYVPVPGSPSQKQHVSGQVETYTYNLDLGVQSGSSGNWNFGGDTAWFNLYSLVWNQASSDPTNSSVAGKTFESPLYAVVSNVQWSNQGSSQIDSALVGHAFTFYSEPKTAGQTLATLSNYTPGANVNSSLGSQYAPDSRFQRLVYYPVSMTSLQANYNAFVGRGTCGVTGCTYPSVTLTVTLYTLRIGEYILTNPNTQGLNGRNQPCTGLGCLTDFFSNPFNQLAAALGVGLAIVVIVVVFASPVVVALIFALSNRKRGL